MSIPFILDTDTAQDDCVAILLGVLDELADLRAVTMVAGNVGFDQQTNNALMTLSVAGALGEVPVFLGCRRPMVREWVSAENVHGDGAGGLSMDTAGVFTEPEHAVDALLRLTREEPGELNIVAIGPLTNIAMAVVKDPDFPARVKHLFIMGGSNNARGNITAAAEFNFYVDPDAAKIVFDAGFDITVVPWEPLTVRDAIFSRAQMAEIGAQESPVAQFFQRVCETTLEFDESVGIPGSSHPDSLTVAVMLHPELVIKSAAYRVDIEADSELTRGYSAMSWGIHGLKPNARVIEDVDAAGFFSYIKSMMATKTAPSRAIIGL
ncbi:nucleoside hydrolase [Pontimonas sp.]|nr:nucleoside hydrolase [Pontimonas sp.]